MSTRLSRAAAEIDQRVADLAQQRRLLAISREAYKDPRFKYFGELPEDTFEAFLSAPLIARNPSERAPRPAVAAQFGSRDHDGELDDAPSESLIRSA